MAFKFNLFNPDDCFAESEQPVDFEQLSLEETEAVLTREPCECGVLDDDRFFPLWDVALGASIFCMRREAEGRTFRTTAELERLIDHVERVIHIAIALSGKPPHWQSEQEWLRQAVKADIEQGIKRPMVSEPNYVPDPHELFGGLAFRLVHDAVEAGLAGAPWITLDLGIRATHANEMALHYFQDLHDSRKSTATVQSVLSSHGKRAVNLRHDRTTRAAKEKALELYAAKQWRSKRQAAKTIFPEVAKFARSIGWTISEDSGLDTVYRWIREADKESL